MRANVHILLFDMFHHMEETRSQWEGDGESSVIPFEETEEEGEGGGGGGGGGKGGRGVMNERDCELWRKQGRRGGMGGMV